MDDGTTSFPRWVAVLKDLGFDEFCSVKNLQNARREHRPPPCKGIYLVIRNRKDRPEFLLKGTGGKIRRKDKNGKITCKDPNVDTGELEKRWVKGALILYVGKSVNLRTRIRQLIRFGDGKKSPHGGGRYLWQIADAEDFKIFWKEVPNEDQAESRMLESFARAHNGMLPFANIIKT